MKKSWMTNLVGYFGAIIIIASLVLVYLGKVDYTDVLAAGSGLGVILSTLNGFLAKDSDTLSEKSNILDPDKDDGRLPPKS